MYSVYQLWIYSWFLRAKIVQKPPISLLETGFFQIELAHGDETKQFLFSAVGTSR